MILKYLTINLSTMRLEVDIMENIEMIKDEILSYCKHSKEKLRLLKSYYTALNIIGFIVVIVGYLIKSMINNGYKLMFLDAAFQPYHVIVLAIIIIIVIYNELSLNKNKSLSIFNILEEIVEIKSKENNND